MNDIPTPDTMSYLLLGLTVVVILVGGFVTTLVLRFRGLQQDIKTIEQLNDQ